MAQYRIGGIDPNALETLRNLNPFDVSRFIHRENVAAFLDASRVSQIGSRRLCQPTKLWILAGDGLTDGNGEAIININRRLCLAHDEDSREDAQLHIIGEPWLVATPISDSPVVLTTSVTMDSLGRLIDQSMMSPDPPTGGDVEIFNAEVRVKSWQLDGNAAPDTSFAWHCRVQGVRSFYIGG